MKVVINKYITEVSMVSLNSQTNVTTHL